MERAAPDEGYCMVCSEHKLWREIAVLNLEGRSGPEQIWICRECLQRELDGLRSCD